jgi:hypothetical protein
MGHTTWDLGRLDQVVVVQHQRDPGTAGQLVDQRGHHRLGRSGLQLGRQQRVLLGEGGGGRSQAASAHQAGRCWGTIRTRRPPQSGQRVIVGPMAGAPSR